MISFRFHLVSLIAVFLALGLGILAGTTVINRGLIAQLEQQTKDIEAGRQQLREDVEALQAEVDRASAFAQESVAYLTDGRLAQRDVVVVTEEGTDPEAIDGAQRGLAEARAEVVALLALDGSLMDVTGTERGELAGSLGLDDETDPEEFAAQIASVLAERIAFGPTPGSPDPLATLLERGFVVNLGPPLDDAGLRDLGSDAVVVVGGGAAEDASPTLVPLVEALAEAGSPVAAVEAVDSTQPFVEELRGGGVADAISTQDNVDELFGEVGLVLALDHLLNGGEPGHFGVKDGATSVIPPPA